jgi:FecR protein
MKIIGTQTVSVIFPHSIRKICFSLVLSIIFATVAVAQTMRHIGKLSVVRQVYATPGLAGGSVVYRPATQGQQVFDGQGIRTLKRSQAEVAFKDTSLLRINERTDIVLRDTSVLRSIKLSNGAIWIRVAKGVQTKIDTPTATLAARGTVFVVDQDDEGTMTTWVLEGAIDVLVDGQTIVVPEGRMLRVRGKRNIDGHFGEFTWGEPTFITSSSLITPWWEMFRVERGRSVYIGSESALVALEEPLLEIENDLAGFPTRSLLGVNGYPVGFVIRSEQTTSLSDSSLITDNSISNSARFFAAQLGKVTGGDLAPAFVGLFAAISGIKLGEESQGDATWNGSTSFFGNKPYGYAGRIRSSYALDKGRVLGVGNVLPPTHVVVEANAGRLLTNAPVGSFSRLDTVAYVNKPLTPNLSIFSGRRRFYHGASFLNAHRTPLIADFYTGTGLTYQSNDWRIEAAFVEDIAADEAGSQNGFLASAWYTNHKGVLGGHLLRQEGGDSGTGYSLSATYPLLLHQLDIYGEAGKNANHQDIRTLGLYFPSLYQKYDLDIALEYNHRQGEPATSTLVAQKKVKSNATARVFVTRVSNDTILGLGGTFRFGNTGIGKGSSMSGFNGGQK